MRDRKTGQSEEVAVATCVFADTEGPVLVDLWREVATSNVSMFVDFISELDESSPHPPLIELKYFGIRPESRKPLIGMRKIVTSERTVFTRLLEGTRSTVTQMGELPPSESLFTRDLTVLMQEPPFVVSIAGIIGLCVEERETANGRLRRGFQLHDSNGKYVLCEALGRHASNSCIEDGHEVVLYFAQAMAQSSSNTQSVLWLYDESHMVILSHDNRVPSGRSVIEFRSSSRW